jgi:predicted transposase YdaD
LKEAVRLAAEECEKEGKLREFLAEHRKEVQSMFSLMYDEDTARKVAREEGREDGLEEGIERGREEGITITAAVIRAINERIPDERIAEQYRISIGKIAELKSVLVSLTA